MLTNDQLVRLKSICHDHLSECFGDAIACTMECDDRDYLNQIEVIEMCLAGGSMDHKIPADISKTLETMEWEDVVQAGKQIFPHKRYS